MALHKDLIVTRAGKTGPRLLLLEPYLTSSHRALVRGLMEHIPARWTLLGLSGRNFRWRMRGAASFLAQEAKDLLAMDWDGLICSSMLDLAALRGLAPGLARTPALVYFHENQLDYPTPGRADQVQRRRDLYLAFCNLASAQAADQVVFNSAYHQKVFLNAARDLLGWMPDATPQGLWQDIAAKSAVLAVPLEVESARNLSRGPRSGPLRLVWNHRWCDEKGPEVFFEALLELAGRGMDFQVAVLGRSSGNAPDIFKSAQKNLAGRIAQWGAVDERQEYWGWLFWADVVVSTAYQEFLGLSVAEAVWAGCRPLVPDGLAYPELYGNEFRYAPGELETSLRGLMERPENARQEDYRPLVEHLTWQALQPAWESRIQTLISG